jgi:hypothetical protein
MAIFGGRFFNFSALCSVYPLHNFTLNPIEVHLCLHLLFCSGFAATFARTITLVCIMH